MAAIIKTDYRFFNQDSFNYILNKYLSKRLYVFIAKNTAWGDEINPDLPTNKLSDENQIRSEILALKYVQPVQIRRGIRRYDWASGTVYDAWKHDTEMRTKKFFVITNEFQVYKCIWNGSGAQSTFKPTGTSTGVITFSDGYKWKFMFKLSEDDILTYLTSEFIPVKTILFDDGSAQWDVQAAAVDGAINYIEVTAGGSGYTSGATASIVDPLGMGTGASATVNVTSGVVTSVDITTPGTGYRQANVTISPVGAGSGATAKAIISPPGGHGFNPGEEMYGTALMVPVTFDGTEGGEFPLGTYRRVGVLADPRATTANAGTELVVTFSASDAHKSFKEGEEVTLSGNPSLTPKKTVNTWDPVNKVLILNDSDAGLSNYPAASTVTGVTSGLVVTIVNSKKCKLPLKTVVSDAGEVDKFTGDLVYVENILSTTRAESQKEEIRLAIEF